MKVEDYEYGYNYDDEEEVTLKRKEDLIKKVKNQIIKDNIDLSRILKIGKNNAEYEFIYDWLNQNHVKITGINGSISGEIDNYVYVPKMGQSKTPDVLDDVEQQKLFDDLNNLRKKGVDKDSKEYQDIRYKLITHNMRLAKWVANARYFKDLGFDREDIQQLAMEGLIMAVDKFDGSAGNKFSTYAVNSMFYFIKRQGRQNQNSDVYKAEKKKLEMFEDEMLKRIGREPTDEEIKEFLGVSDKNLKQLKEFINFHNPVSLDELNEKNEEMLIDDLLDDERLEEINGKQINNGVYVDQDALDIYDEQKETDTVAFYEAMKDDIRKVMEKFTETEREVIELRFGLKDDIPRSLEQVRKYI